MNIVQTSVSTGLCPCNLRVYEATKLIVDRYVHVISVEV